MAARLWRHLVSVDNANPSKLNTYKRFVSGFDFGKRDEGSGLVKRSEEAAIEAEVEKEIDMTCVLPSLTQSGVCEEETIEKSKAHQIFISQ
ncbi:hypothetical protein CHUAL_002934 [Chamberlinius hualienensis]